VQHLLQRRRRADLEVLVVEAQAREAEADQVEDVRDVVLGGEEARAAGERRSALGREGERLLETGRAVVAADAAGEQWVSPGRQGILAVSAGPGRHVARGLCATS
jgi:hypothetical protein